MPRTQEDDDLVGMELGKSPNGSGNFMAHGPTVLQRDHLSRSVLLTNLRCSRLPSLAEQRIPMSSSAK